jgi:hypothetical protein
MLTIAQDEIQTQLRFQRDERALMELEEIAQRVQEWFLYTSTLPQTQQMRPMEGVRKFIEQMQSIVDDNDQNHQQWVSAQDC